MTKTAHYHHYFWSILNWFVLTHVLIEESYENFAAIENIEHFTSLFIEKNYNIFQIPQNTLYETP